MQCERWVLLLKVHFNEGLADEAKKGSTSFFDTKAWLIDLRSPNGPRDLLWRVVSG